MTAQTPTGGTVWALTCGHCRACDKMSYASRALARAATRRMTGRDHGSRPRPYRCPVSPAGMPAVWHLGHLPRVVIRGQLTRSELRINR